MSNEYVHLIDQLHQQVLIVFVLPVWKPDWLPLDHKEKPQSTIFNVQIISAFRALDILIQAPTFCWPAVVDDDLGVSKFLVFEAEFDLLTLLNSSKCFFPIPWSVFADRPLDESSKVLW